MRDLIRRLATLGVIGILAVNYSISAETGRAVMVIIDDQKLRIELPMISPDMAVPAQDVIAGRVRRAIMERLINKLDAYHFHGAIEEAAHLFWRERTSQSGGAEQRFHEIKSAQEKLVRGLKLVVNDKRKPSEVYREMFKNDMPEKSWSIWVQEFESPEKIAELERMNPQSDDELYQFSKNSIRFDILQWLVLRQMSLKQRLELSKAQLEEAAKRPEERKSRLEIKIEHRMKALRDHWPKYIEELDIEIPEEFAKARPLISRLSVPTLPESVIKLLEERVTDDELATAISQ